MPTTFMLFALSSAFLCGLSHGHPEGSGCGKVALVEPGYPVSMDIAVNDPLLGLVNRSFVVSLPKLYSSQTSYPLLVVLHGQTGNAMDVAKTSNYTTVGNTNGFITVFPQGAFQKKKAEHFLMF